MKFEVTDKREQKEGLIFKKSVYLATASIQLDTDELEALKSMASTKQWKEYELSRVQYTEKIGQDITVSMLYSRTKQTGRFEKGIRTTLPEERELQIVEMKELAQAAKRVIDTRLSALDASDDDVSVEL